MAEANNHNIISPWFTKKEIANYFQKSIRTISNLKRKRIISYKKALGRYNVHDCERALKRYEIRSIGDFQSCAE